MANSPSWLPFQGDASSRRAAVLGAALVLSLGLHVALPFVRWHHVEAVSESPITVELMPPPPMPLPEADELKPVPNEEDSPSPPEPDKPAQADTAPAPTKAAAAAEEPEPAPVEEPVEPEPPAPSEAAPPAVLPDQAAAARLAELERRRAERLAARERRLAEREARRAARLAEAAAKAGAKAGAGGEKGGAPDSGDWRTGKPSAVYLCSATGKGDEVRVSKSRPISEWVTIVPTALAGFSTRPALGGYLGGIQQVVGRDRTVGPRRIGFVEMSLPNDVLQIDLEEPRGVRIAVGRLDARCLIGFKYAQGLFPFSVVRAPVRLIDGQNNSVSALVDVTFFKDASLEIVAADGTALPFRRARLKNAQGITNNIRDHYEAARLAKGIADLFGIKLGSSSKPRGTEAKHSTSPGGRSDTARTKNSGPSTGR